LACRATIRMAMEAFEQTNVSQTIPSRETNDGASQIAQSRETNLQGNRVLRMASAPTSEY